MHALIWLIIFLLILIWFIIGVKICYSPSAKSEIITNVKKGRVDDIGEVPAADVQPEKISKWCPPLMGQGKCDTYCERYHGKIMRNSTGIFEKTPFCPHCGARMDGDTNG